MIRLLFCFILLPSSFCLSAAAPFVITVEDDQTHRGVPLVELTTVDQTPFITDSAGKIAFDEPGLMNQRVFFTIKSHGYEFTKDGFGFRGTSLDVKPGGSATLAIKRINIAQRLYRITGQGIFRDTVLAGRTAPIKEPLLNAQVIGQDSAHAVIFQDQIHWFWGDTNRPAYPLGHFGTAGAISKLPGNGGLDPDIGIDLTYFTDDKGFSRPMLAPKAGPRWVDGAVSFKDQQGAEHLIARCDTMKDLGHRLEREILEWNAQTKKLEPIQALDRDETLCPFGHPFTHAVDGETYLYFGEPYPNLRVKADLTQIKTPAAYEGFTCLAAGARFEGGNTKLDRDTGAVVWAWKKNTPPVNAEQLDALIKHKLLKPDEAWNQTVDVDSNQPIRLHAGSAAWNPFKKKWVLIANQTGGKSSFLGEVYVAWADQPHGPYLRAQKIVTHDRYSFYNPVHHPFFDQQGGRIIYFEGTYAATFSGNDHPTPRYDYNQIMYRLDLSDARLKF